MVRMKRYHRRKLDINQHICDLHLGSDSHLPRLPPNAPFMMRFKRWLQKLLLVSARHPLTHIYLRSMAAIAFEKRRHGISPHWWIIHPCSNFRFTWDMLMGITFLYLFFMIPYTMAFTRLSTDQVDAIERTLSLLTLPYLICLIDIAFNFISGFISSDGHEIYIDPTLTFKHYIKGLFPADIISSVPYTWFYKKNLQMPKANGEKYLVFLELLLLFKFCRLFTFKKSIKKMAMATGSSRIYEHGVWLFFLTILIFHWAACFTYMFPFFYSYLRNYSLEEAQGYLFHTKLYQKPTWMIYLTSLHMGGGNLCSYNFLEYEYTSIPDKMARCILLLCGMTYFLYVIVIILQLTTSTAEPELKFQAIMHGVKDYIRNKKLTEDLRERLEHFYEHRFQGSLFKEKAITSILSKQLRHEITQHSSRILLESAPLFRNVTRSMINNIIGALKQVIFLKNDVIFKWGAEGNYLYFIITGTIVVLSVHGEEISHIVEPNYFGEIALFRDDHKRTTTVIALEECEVLRLDRRNFNRLIKPKSSFYKRLESIAKARSTIVDRYNAQEGYRNEDGHSDLF